MGSFNVALLEALLSVGIPPERARAVVDQFDRAIDERYGLHAQVLATKRDVADLNVALSKDIAGLDTRLSGQIAELDARVSGKLAELDTRLSGQIAALDARLSTLIAETKSDLAKWVLAALTAQTALLLGAVKFF